MRFARELAGDVRYGARLLRRTPAFTLVAALSLALGIAGATTVFSLVNAIILKPLPVANPEQLYLVRVSARPGHPDLQSAPAFAAAREAMAGRAELFAATGMTSMQLWPAGDPAATRGAIQLVSGEFFQVLRQRPQLGRLIQPSDNVQVGGHPVAVISDEFWRTHFQASPAVIGTPMTINGAGFTIIGVAARGFFGTVVSVSQPDAWVPFMMQSSVRYASNASDAGGDSAKPWPPQGEISWLNVFVRVPRGTAPGGIASGISLVLQQEAIRLLPPQVDETIRRQVRDTRAVLESASGGVSNLRRDTSTPLLVLLAMVGVLLAIACGNVAGLLLSRSASRHREVAIRLSIGANRLRIVRQMLAESLLLGLGAGAVGLGLAVWLHEPLLRLIVPRATTVDLETGVDWRVLSFVAGVSVLTGLACGVVPALRGTRVPLTESLKQQARGSVGSGRRGMLAGRALVAAQMAFCLLLLVVAGLFARSLQSVAGINVGFDQRHVLVAGLDVRGAGYAPEDRLALYQRLIDRMQRIPGVESVSLSANGPLANSSWRSGMTVEGYTPAPGERLTTNEEIVAGRYFETVGLKLVEGREFEPQDRRRDSRATIVNETMAKRFFPGQSAIGKRWSYDSTIDEHAFTIVGVVEDARYLTLKDAPPTMAYHPAEFDPDTVIGDLEIRTTAAPATLVGAVRQALTEGEPRLPVTEIVPLQDRISRGLSQERLVAELSSAFGALALLLACLGLYGTISYGISRRVAELGLRMALGADRGMVLRMVLREAMVLVAIGAAVGLPLAFAAGRAVGALLYGVPPADVVSFAGGAAVLVAVAAAAAYLPAYRASRIAPMTALNR